MAGNSSPLETKGSKPFLLEEEAPSARPSEPKAALSTWIIPHGPASSAVYAQKYPVGSSEPSEGT